VDLIAFVGRFFCTHFHPKDTSLISEQQVVAGIPADDLTSDRYQGRLGCFDTHCFCLNLLRLRMLALTWGLSPDWRNFRKKTGGAKQSPWSISRRQFVAESRQATKNNRCWLFAVACIL
jgi:hypothetical protein